MSVNQATIAPDYGVYGLMAWRVATRKTEIGVRLALGAATGAVVRAIVAEGARLAIGGIVIGLAGALAATRVLAAFLFGVRPAEPVIYAMTGSMITAVAILACWIPARRAARVDPASVLSAE